MSANPHCPTCGPDTYPAADACSGTNGTAFEAVAEVDVHRYRGTGPHNGPPREGVASVTCPSGPIDSRGIDLVDAIEKSWGAINQARPRPAPTLLERLEKRIGARVEASYQAKLRVLRDQLEGVVAPVQYNGFMTGEEQVAIEAVVQSQTARLRNEAITETLNAVLGEEP